MPNLAAGQGAVGVTQLRPFVIGFIPVVGPRGGVGGVLIDAQGVVSRSDEETTGRLREARLRALAPLSGDLLATSPLRKVSLRGLVAALDQQRKAGKPAGDDLLHLAGLTRVEYVLVYPEQRDIVLAGPAEGWEVDGLGHVVGRTSGRPVVQLDDLVVALRAAKGQVAAGDSITCSIEPTPEGLTRYIRLLSSQRGEPTEAQVARLEQAIGPQQVKLTGIPPGTHFARVLLAADFMMKRLGMNFEPAPVEGLPSYLEMLQEPSAPTPRNAMPRWWMAAHYEPLLKDESGLAWQLRGQGVQTLAEDGMQGKRGAVVPVRRENSLAKDWADAMTAKYDALAARLPIFAELRNCMDLAVIAALLVKENLAGRSGCDLGLLLDEKQLAVAEQQAPKTIDSKASLVRKGKQTIISVSGGVEVDPWSVLERAEVGTQVAELRTRAGSLPAGRWWWD
jgi:hypothetical protein